MNGGMEVRQTKVHNHVLQPVGVEIDFSAIVSLLTADRSRLSAFCKYLGSPLTHSRTTALKSFVRRLTHAAKPSHLFVCKSFGLDSEISLAPDKQFSCKVKTMVRRHTKN